MGETRLTADSEPELEIRQLSAEHNGIMGCWSIPWLVKNTGPHPLRILAVRLPHGQFKSKENRFEPAIELKPGEETPIQTLVRCHEPPGPVTENAFVIFHVIWRDESWRIFTRIRVAINPDGKPQTTTELITTQKVGFSSVKS